jgi:hypothetical protein
MKVVIAGSRNISDRLGLVKAIKQSGFDITEVVSGKARGVDTLGETWAMANDIVIKQFPADWAKHGNAAGPIRNAIMAEYADAAIILWDGESKGTLNMIKNMHKLDKPYFIRMSFNETSK